MTEGSPPSPAATPRDSAWTGLPADAAGRLRLLVERPPHAVMVVGPPGAGTRDLATAYAAEVLAAVSPQPDAAFARALGGNHSDFSVVERVGPHITVEQAREVVRTANLAPREGPRKVVLLVDLHLAAQAAAVLLKVMEEPPAGSHFVVTCEEVTPELETVASRCVVIEVTPPTVDEIASRLVVEGHDPETSLAVAQICERDLDRARLLASDPRFAERVEMWWSLPGRLDGRGATVHRLVTDIREMLDSVSAQQEGSGASQDRRRIRRRMRDAELRAGLATLYRRYRESLDHSRETKPIMDSLQEITAAAEALERNASEDLLLAHLLLSLHPLPEATGPVVSEACSDQSL
ncbi:MAG: hypothetical protein KatS3mg008_1543 [Acidimicrobiales bacterium]|nr:MAG: hypothetical protein KatS3mg008_1543 [Acidimicrobiales bacterium]